MKILLINYEYPPFGGGAGNATRYLASELRQLGHDVAVLTGGKSREEQVEGVRVIRVGSVRKREDCSSIWEMISFVSRSILWMMTKEGIGWKFSIIFFGMPCGVLGPVLRIRGGTPYIISLRGGDVPGFEPSLDRLHRFLSPLRRYVYRSSVKVVANSQALAKLSIRSDPFPISIVPNGVEERDFFPIVKPVSSCDDSLSILIASRFHEQKNIPQTIERLARARQHGLQFKLTLIGDGPERDRIQKVIMANDLVDNVTLVGWLSRSHLAAKLQRADCFVSMSRYEGMPNAILEAMACGVPVIASGIAAHEEIINDGIDGYLVDLDSDRALEEILVELWKKPQQARVVGTNACEKVRRCYSWNASAKSYLALMQDSPVGRDHA